MSAPGTLAASVPPPGGDDPALMVPADAPGSRAAAQPLDAFGCALQGVQLIEASAGTGKTWNLCVLALRLVLEQGLGVDQVLVVTFTQAATAELKLRLRRALADTLDALDARSKPAADAMEARLLAALRQRGLDDTLVRRRLQAALDRFDEAAILTIHGFCQRALADTPLAGGMPLRSELDTDDQGWIERAARDFWRRHIAGDTLGRPLAQLLLDRGDHPERLARLLKRHLARPTAVLRWPAELDTTDAFDEAATRVRLGQALDRARELWALGGDGPATRVREAVARKDLNGRTYPARSIDRCEQAWDALLREPDPLATLRTDWTRRLDAGRDDAEARNASSAGKGGRGQALDAASADKDGPDAVLARLAQRTLASAVNRGRQAPEHPFFDAAQGVLDARRALWRGAALQRLRLLHRWLHEGAIDVRRAKREARVVGFDDMLANLHHRLTDGSAPWLAPALRVRFPAALIDEFQDTDPLQYGIFEAIHARAGLPLCLIGDPKQAIYAFRHADLPTYLRAARQARAHHTLVDNQRSSAALVGALNTLFGANPLAFMQPGLAWREAGVGARPRGTFEDDTGPDAGPRAALQLWALPRDPDTGQPLLRAEAAQACVRACAGEIARMLRAASHGAIRLEGRPLGAGDIAVLVRSHADARLVRDALATQGVASVALSQASVFASPDAEDLQRLLEAVLEPSRLPALRRALATVALGVDAAALEALAADPAALQRHLQSLAALRALWVGRGIGLMLRQWMARDGVAARMLARRDGARRLTNLRHLTELLHQASADHPAPPALLAWLRDQRRRALEGLQRDEAQLRLDTDRHLVRIVTIHKAKGLEYPVVFCPLLWQAGTAIGPDEGLDGVAYHDVTAEGEDASERAIIDFRRGLDPDFDDDRVKERRRSARAAEDIRLVYVALTRAVHRCVLVVGNHSSLHGSNASSTQGCRSLLNWLAAGAGMTPAQWFAHNLQPDEIDAAWRAIAAHAGPGLGLAPLPAAPLPAVPLASDAPPQRVLAAAPRIPPSWRLGSYSALRHGSGDDRTVVDHDLRATSERATEAPSALPADDILRFPRGAREGTCMHAVFEAIDFTQPAGWGPAIDAALRRLPTPRTEAAASAEAARDPPAGRLATMLRRMVADVLQTPLPVGTTRPLVLAEVPLTGRLTEWEFHLPAPRLQAGPLQALLAQAGWELPPLDFPVLRGYLKGFVDLIVEHEGRHFVLDWKSNHLGFGPADYGPAQLARTMAEEGYHLQHLLYGVALHRHLRLRLQGYDPAQHLGGAVYLFVRGVRPGWRDDDGRPLGASVHRHDPALVSALSALIGGEDDEAALAGHAGQVRPRTHPTPGPRGTTA